VKDLLGYSAIAGAVAILIFGMRCARAYDHFVRLLFTQHRGIWRKVGSPHGYFWRPEATFAKTVAIDDIDWFGRTIPDWVTASDELRRRFVSVRRSMQRFVIAVLVGVPLGLVLMLLTSMVAG
jgi:hypothetical protein